MRVSKCCAALSVAFAVALGASSASAQGFAGILDKLNKIEERLDGLEAAPGASGEQLVALSTTDPTAAESASASEVADLRDRLDRVAAGLEQVQAEVWAPGPDPVLLALDSSVADLQLKFESLVDAKAGNAAGGEPGPADVAQLTADLRALVDELRSTVAQSPPRNITFAGQVRPRSEYASPAAADTRFTSMRVRAQISAALSRDLKAFIQFQDVRLWGEETNTLGDFRADNFDLHQGYIDVSRVGGAPASVRIGRQALALGGQRLIGSVEWTQQGRVFDGVRLTLGSGGKVYVFGFQLAEERAANIATNAYLTGVYAQGLPLHSTSLDGYVLYNRVSGKGTDQVTFGARWLGKAPAFRLEGAYQTGTRADRDVSAFMLGARVGATALGGKGKIALWYDYLSGSDDPAGKDQNAFDTLFATNHKYYGYADLFLNIPVHTAGRGLQDLALKTKVSPHARLTLGADLHAFLLAQSKGLDSGHLGEEVDVTISYKYSSELTIVGGFSHVFAAKGMAAIGRADKDVDFAYLMTNVVF